MAIVPIKNAVIIKELIDEKLKNNREECNLRVVSKLLDIIIKKGYGGISFHSAEINENGCLKFKDDYTFDR